MTLFTNEQVKRATGSLVMSVDMEQAEKLADKISDILGAANPSTATVCYVLAMLSATALTDAPDEIADLNRAVTHYLTGEMRTFVMQKAKGGETIQ